MRLGSRDCPSWSGIKSTRFHGPKCGDLQDCVKGVVYGGSVRGGDSIGCGVDGGGGSRVESDNEPHWD